MRSIYVRSAVLFLFAALSLHGQANQGSITGTIRDQTSAVMPNAGRRGEHAEWNRLAPAFRHACRASHVLVTAQFLHGEYLSGCSLAGKIL